MNFVSVLGGRHRYGAIQKSFLGDPARGYNIRMTSADLILIVGEHPEMRSYLSEHLQRLQAGLKADDTCLPNPQVSEENCGPVSTCRRFKILIARDDSATRRAPPFEIAVQP